jgi:Raf kinase inhibitor-like YbhB/YbcL family protein
VSKKTAVAGVILCIVVFGAYYIFRPAIPSTPKVVQVSMKLTSSAFENNQKIPARYTCDGQKSHPPLTISGVPSAAKSLALIVDDPDAPTGTFTHWVIWNIRPDTSAIPEGTVPPESQEGTNSAGTVGYTPPCPPPAGGQHRYFFTLYALDAVVGLDGKATKADVEKVFTGRVTAQSLLVGVYSR